eukprot:gene10420-2551_t
MSAMTRQQSIKVSLRTRIVRGTLCPARRNVAFCTDLDDQRRRQQATNGTTWNSKCAQEFLVQSETAATLERYSIDFVFLLWMFNCSSKKPVKEAELHTFSWLVWYQSAPQTDRVGM